MHRKLVALALLFLTSQLISPEAVLSAKLKYDPDGSTGTLNVQGSLHTAQEVGGMKLNDGSAILQANILDIQSSEPAGRVTVLSGIVITPRANTSGSHGTASGYVYFNTGEGLAQIDDPDTEELISVDGGGTVTGHITAVTREQVTIATKTGEQRIGTERIKRLCSPRIYRFSINLASVELLNQGTGSVAANTGSITLTPTTRRCKMNKTETAEDSKRRRRQCCITIVASEHNPMPLAAKVAIGLGVAAAVATAITLPIAIPLAARHTHSSTVPNNVAIYNLLRNQNTPPPPPPPPPPPQQSQPPPPPPA